LCRNSSTTVVALFNLEGGDHIFYIYRYRIFVGKKDFSVIIGETTMLSRVIAFFFILQCLIRIEGFKRSFVKRLVHEGRYRSQLHTAMALPLDGHTSSEVPPKLGRVSLVGAGPGDPDLLTLGALKLIKSASLVISDRLVSKELLDLVDCELRIARKRPGCAEEAQDEIYQWVREAVLAGRDVVRLKIGDPFLFGRGGEEILEFRKLGVEPVVVPGVSSSYAAPLVAGIPLTHRGTSNSVIITTGYGKDATVIEVPEFRADRTVVLLMAVGRIEEIAGNMTAIGYPTDTPVAIIEKATTPQQRTLTGTLKTIGSIAKREQAVAPATIIVGEVVNVLRGQEVNQPLAAGMPISDEINPVVPVESVVSVSHSKVSSKQQELSFADFIASTNSSRIV
jgi:uroporphyrin-III C-methyltransferase